MTDNAFDPDDLDNSEVMRLIREAIAKSRGYADFFQWPDKSIVEQHVAQLVCNFLVHRGEIRVGQVSAVKNDPPDALYVTGDGLRLGIEVTELVSAEMVKRVRHLKEHGQPIDGLMAVWTPGSVAQELERLIKVKDAKLAKVASMYDRLLLAIHTDESTVDETVAQSVAAACAAGAKWIDSVFCVVSYHPRTDESTYPDKHAIVPIPISRIV